MVSNRFKRFQTNKTVQNSLKPFETAANNSKATCPLCKQLQGGGVCVREVGTCGSAGRRAGRAVPLPLPVRAPAPPRQTHPHQHTHTRTHVPPQRQPPWPVRRRRTSAITGGAYRAGEAGAPVGRPTPPSRDKKATLRKGARGDALGPGCVAGAGMKRLGVGLGGSGGVCREGASGGAAPFLWLVGRYLAAGWGAWTFEGNAGPGEGGGAGRLPWGVTGGLEFGCKCRARRGRRSWPAPLPRGVYTSPAPLQQ